MGKIKVAVVDDSALVRQVLAGIINGENDMEVVSTSPDPVSARAKFDKLWPDVIITDIEMPKKDGIAFLEEIMKEKPTPVIICSSHTSDNTSLAVRAMSMGAVDVIEKPKIGVKGFLEESVTVITDSVRSAAGADAKKIKLFKPVKIEPKLSADAVIPLAAKTSDDSNADKIVIIGASAGGTQAIEYILTNLPDKTPPIMIVQQMPPVFTKAFAQRLDSISRLSVKEASDGESVLPSTAFIAPGGMHMLIDRNGGHYKIRIKDGPLVTRHRPSVDVLYRSAARSAGKNALGIILTGMGDDGARGMREMHNSGIRTIAQDEESCVVFGMPKEAIKTGAVDEILSLQELPQRITAFWNRNGT